MTLPDRQSNTVIELPTPDSPTIELQKADRTRFLEHVGDLQALNDRSGLPAYLGRLCAWLDLGEITVAAWRKTSLPDVAFDGAGYDEQWRELYLRERLILVDPIVRLIADGQPFVDRDWIINEQQAAARGPAGIPRSYDRFIQLARRHGRERGGFAGGVVHNGWVALFSAVSAHRRSNPCAPLVLFALRPVLCQAILHLLLPEFRSSVLSEREQAMLEYLANGYGDIQIADALAISVPTVRFHMRNVFDKLGARNRCHAVAIGFQSGLLQRWSDVRLPATASATDGARLSHAPDA